MNESTDKTAATARKRFIRIALGIGIVTALLLAGFVTTRVVRHNFHVVSPGMVYRSAQLDGAGFRRMIRENGIKSVFNLRGSNQTSWYDAETNASQEMGVRHFDFSLSASQQLNVGQMEDIVTALALAPKPILIHCKNGADRSGLVGALYLYTQEGKPAQTAFQELTVLCGHFPHLFWRDTIAMDDSFWRYAHSHVQSTNLLGAIVLSKD